MVTILSQIYYVTLAHIKDRFEYYPSIYTCVFLVISYHHFQYIKRFLTYDTVAGIEQHTPTALKEPSRMLCFRLLNIIKIIAYYSISLKLILISSFHLHLIIPSGLISSRLPTKTLYDPPFPPIHTACPTHPTLLDLITQITFGEQYRSCSSSLCSLLPTPPNPPVTLSS